MPKRCLGLRGVVYNGFMLKKAKLGGGVFLSLALAVSGAGAQPVLAAGDELPAFFVGGKFLDARGKVRSVGDEEADAGGAAVIFFGDGCPLSEQYAGQLNQFAEKKQREGEYVYGVLLADSGKWRKAREFQKRNNLSFPVFADPSGDLSARATVAVAPTAVVYDIGGKLIYAGNADANLDKSLTAAPKPCKVAQPKPQSPPTYHRDIAPLIAANCLECHRTGGIAPFSLEEYDTARAFAPLLKQVTQSRRMPPWKPKPQPGTYRNERILSAKQIAMFAQWADAGAPEGDKADAPPKPDLGDVVWRLGKPDLVLKMREPFEVPATGDDIYRYFVLPSGLSEDKTMIGVDFVPGDASVVHHANFFADYSGKARRKDAEDKQQGFSVFGTGAFMSYDNAEDESSFGIGGWVPGADPYRRPMYGVYLPAGADIVIEIHYKLSGRKTTDQSSIGLYFSERETPHYMDGLLIGTQDLNIPPNDAAYARHFYMDVPAGFTLVDFLPHMHYIGKEAKFEITFPDGKKRELVDIKDWDLDWQSIYVLRKPIHIPAGSRLDAWFTYDNTPQNPENPHNPPQKIKWGWKSEDEMAEVWMGIIPDNWNNRKALIEASQLSWWRSAAP